MILPLKHGIGWIRIWYSRYIDEADSKAKPDIELDIMGCDIDGRMVEIAKANARESR